MPIFGGKPNHPIAPESRARIGEYIPGLEGQRISRTVFNDRPEEPEVVAKREMLRHVDTRPRPRKKDPAAHPRRVVTLSDRIERNEVDRRSKGGFTGGREKLELLAQRLRREAEEATLESSEETVEPAVADPFINRVILRGLVLAAQTRKATSSLVEHVAHIPTVGIANPVTSTAQRTYERARKRGHSDSQEDAQAESGEVIGLGLLTRLRMNTLDRVILTGLDTMGHLGKKVANETNPFDRDEEGKNHLRKRGKVLLGSLVGAVALAGLAYANEKFGLAHETQHLAHEAYNGLQNIGQNTHEHAHTAKGTHHSLGGHVIQQAHNSTTPSGSTVGNHTATAHEPTTGLHRHHNTGPGAIKHITHEVAGSDTAKTAEHFKANNVNLNDWTWNVAHQTAPGHESEVISQALQHFGHRVHWGTFKGTRQIFMGNGQIVNHQQMEVINRIVVKLGSS